jgi:Cfr10I/Bse634I restriction endonuclease
MTYVRILPGGKTQIEKAKAFCELLNNDLPQNDKQITELLNEFDEEIRRHYPDVTLGALNNSHGDWYEWLLAIKAWNFHVNNPNSFLCLPLPKISSFDVASLYKNDLFDLIIDLREKVQNSANVQLVTSNPDFVLIDTQDLYVPDIFNNRIETINEDALLLINNAYQNFINTCEFNSIVGYLSVKFSLRPDRRLQLAHEGSLMKAIYMHLQTRQWILRPRGLKYYAIASSVGESDRNALKTVATHSIITVHNIPQAAVDEVYSVNTLAETQTVFSEILL